MFKTLSRLENSPRTLMSSLQHRRPPSDEVKTWKARTNDLAVMEILRERRAALESGKLKRRRLFDEVENVIQDFEVCSVTSYDSNDDKELGTSDENLPVCSKYGSSYSSFVSASLCNEFVLKEGEKEVGAELEHRRGVNGGRWKLVLVWIAIAALIVSAFGGFSGYGNEDHHEMILVPT